MTLTAALTLGSIGDGTVRSRRVQTKTGGVLVEGTKGYHGMWGMGLRVWDVEGQWGWVGIRKMWHLG